MAYDADSLVELQRDARARQKQAAAIRPAYELIIPKIEMPVGACMSTSTATEHARSKHAISRQSGTFVDA
jgi:hypothetical protein